MKNKQFALRFIIICLIFALSGCASRTVDRKEQKQKIDFTENVTEETKTDSQTTTKVIDTSTIDEIEIVPIDSTKPIEYNGHKVINGTLKLSKRKNNITTDKVEKVAKNESKAVKTEIEQTIKDDEFKSDRKGFNYSWLWIIIILAFAVIIYRKYLRHWI